MEQRIASLVWLVACWVSGAYLIASGETVFQFGAFGGLLLAGAILLAAIVLFVAGSTPSAVTNCSRANLIVSVLVMSEPLVLQAMAAGDVLTSLWHIPQWMAVFGFLAFNLGLSWLWREKASAWRVIGTVGLVFSAALFMPIYIYLQKGLETVYHNLLHYKPDVLHLDQPGMLPFLLACWFAMLGKMVPHHQSRTGTLWASICWATTIMAFATMAVVTKAELLPQMKMDATLLQGIERLSSEAVYLLFCLVLLLVLVMGYQHAVEAIRGLAHRCAGCDHPRGPRLVWLCVVGWQCLLMSGFIWAEQNLLQIILWFGLLLGPYGVAVVFRSSSALLPLAACASGIPVALIWGQEYGVIVATGAAVLLIGMGALYNKLLNRRRTGKDCGKTENETAQTKRTTLLQ